MNESLNTSSTWKKVCCFVLLFFYCSTMLNNHTIASVCNILNIILVVVMMPDLFREAKKFGGDKRSLLLIPLGAVAIIVLQWILWDEIIMKNITSAAGITVGNANTGKMTGMIMEQPLFMGFMGCVYGPILEELLYRYTAFGVLYAWNRFTAYAVSSLLFGIQHVAEAAIWGGDAMQFINMPSYIIAGLIFAFLYARTKNICVPIGAHILANSFGLMMMVWF